MSCQHGYERGGSGRTGGGVLRVRSGKGVLELLSEEGWDGGVPPVDDGGLLLD